MFDMETDELIPLTVLRSGEKGKIIDILGGANVVRRLDALGVRPGKEIEKVSSSFKGPMVFEVNNTQIAIGYGIAQKILVKK